MKKLSVIILVALIALVMGCGDKADVPPKEDVKTPENEVQSPVEEKPEEIPDVSPLAKEYFLEPVEDYSWEREYPVEKVVVHFTSAVVNYRDNPYNMDLIRNIFAESGLSVHYIIDRDGSIFCYMPESRAAWHAGVGEYGEDERYTNSMNKYSVGIELVAIGSEQDMAQYLHTEEYVALDKSLIGFTDEQYTALSALIKDICKRNNIEPSRENVIGHDEYNPSKTDPGELFDWDRALG